MTSTSRRTTRRLAPGVWCIRKKLQPVQRYNHLAQTYDRRWRTYLRQTLERTLVALKPLTGTEYILDVGCGTGEFERTALERFPGLTLIGVDITPAMLDVARDKLAGKAQVRFLLASAEALPFDAERFDAVVCANMLHHAHRPQQVLRECARVLRPHGQFVLLDWCRDFWHCRLMHAWLRLADRSYVKMYRLAEVTAMLQQCELRVTEVARFLAPPLYGMFRAVTSKESVMASRSN